MLGMLIRGVVIISGSLLLMGSSRSLGPSGVAAWCQTPTEVRGKQPEIVFQVGDYILTSTELEEIANAHTGGPILSRETKAGLVEGLVSTKLFSLAARAAKLDAEAEFQKAKVEARENVLVSVYIQRYVQPKYSEEAVRQYFEAHRDDLKYFSYYRDEIFARLRKQAAAATNESLKRKWRVKQPEDLKTLDLQSADASLILAQVEQKTVTIGDLRKLAFEEYETSNISSFPVEVRLGLLDWLVLERLSLLEAEKAGLANDPAVRKALARSEDQLLAVRYDLRIQGNVGLEEARRYYQAHQEEFKRLDQVWLRQVVVATQEEAKAVKARLDRGDRFEEVAKAVSIERSSAERGGEMGWVRKGRLNPELERVVFQLKPKQVSDPIKTPDGYVMVKVEERLEGAVKPFEEVASQVLLQLKTQATQAERKRLMTIYKVTINEKML